MQATGGYPPEIVDSNGKFSIDGMMMEVDSAGTMTGWLHVKKQSESLKGDPPVGDLLVGKPSLVPAHLSVGALLVGKKRRPD